MELKVTVAQLEAFLAKEFPQVVEDFEFVSVSAGQVVMALSASDKHLRPGGTVSGPSLFGLVDVAAYFCAMSVIGPVALAVTTHCSIDFMRKPEPGRILCDMEILKLGRSLVVTRGLVFTDGAKDKPVAQASVTYSIPPEKPN